MDSDFDVVAGLREIRDSVPAAETRLRTCFDSIVRNAEAREARLRERLSQLADTNCLDAGQPGRDAPGPGVTGSQAADLRG